MAEEKTTNTIDAVSVGVGLLERLAKATKEYGFWGILKSIILLFLCGYCVFFVVNPTYMFEKYDTYIPGDLLRKAYAADRLRPDEAELRIREFAENMI